jgi:hypothetical protein
VLDPYNPSSTTRVLPYDEIAGFYRWEDDPYALQGGSGFFAYEPSAPMQAYWMMRYHGFLAPAGGAL